MNNTYHPVVIVFLIMTLFFSLCFLTYSKKTKHKKNNNISNIKNDLGLKILTNKIIDKSGNRIILKGASTQRFAYHKYPLDLFYKRYDILKKNQINLLGIFVTPETIKKILPNLDTIVAKTEKDNIYIYLMPTLKLEGNVKIFINKLPEFVLTLANRYKKYNHVCNTPGVK